MAYNHNVKKKNNMYFKQVYNFRNNLVNIACMIWLKQITYPQKYEYVFRTCIEKKTVHFQKVE